MYELNYTEDHVTQFATQITATLSNLVENEPLKLLPCILLLINAKWSIVEFACFISSDPDPLQTAHLRCIIFKTVLQHYDRAWLELVLLDCFKYFKQSTLGIMLHDRQLINECSFQCCMTVFACPRSYAEPQQIRHFHQIFFKIVLQYMYHDRAVVEVIIHQQSRHLAPGLKLHDSKLINECSLQSCMMSSIVQNVYRHVDLENVSYDCMHVQFINSVYKARRVPSSCKIQESVRSVCGPVPRGPGLFGH